MTMKIGNIELQSNITLAPLAGWTDYAFRQLCHDYGAGLTTTEMTSVLGLHYNSKNTFELLKTNTKEKPVAVQLFGSDVDAFGEACQSELVKDFDIIDINMGCPVPKIVKNGEGSALMQNPKLAEKIITKCKLSTQKPITVKFRLGFTEQEKNYMEFAKMCEGAGADAITIHGRTRSQFYSGKADWKPIFEVAESVKIPVFANGDVKTKQDYDFIMQNSKCAGVAVGRGFLDKPWLVSEFLGKTIPTIHEVVQKHLSLLQENYSEAYTLLALKKHCVLYLVGKENASATRDAIFKASTIDEVLNLTYSIIKD